LAAGGRGLGHLGHKPEVSLSSIFCGEELAKEAVIRRKLKPGARAIRLDERLDAMIADLDNAVDALAESVETLPLAVASVRAR
jgi:hypothetical protein